MPEFRTEAGLLVPSVTSDEMREIDRIAIDETGPNLYQMMENAGRSLAERAVAMLGDSWRDVPILVLAGTGGNGGGGICAARHLANRGAEVTLALSDPADLGHVPAAQLNIYKNTPGNIAPPTEAGLIVDALIGYSLSGEPRGPVAEMIDFTDGSSAPILALDVPSGVDATTGEAPGTSIAATSTLTLALPKTGLRSASAGDIWLADLGIPLRTFQLADVDVPTGLFGSRITTRLEES